MENIKDTRYNKRSFKISKKEYDFLIKKPEMEKEIFCENGEYNFKSTLDDIYKILNYLKNLYNYQDDLSTVIVYKCYIMEDINPFRKTINAH